MGRKFLCFVMTVCLLLCAGVLNQVNAAPQYYLAEAAAANFPDYGKFANRTPSHTGEKDENGYIAVVYGSVDYQAVVDYVISLMSAYGFNLVEEGAHDNIYYFGLEKDQKHLAIAVSKENVSVAYHTTLTPMDAGLGGAYGAATGINVIPQEAVDCIQCTEGKISCDVCKGTGKSSSMVAEEFNFSVAYPCGPCLGRGFKNCSICNQSGKVANPAYKLYQIVELGVGNAAGAPSANSAAETRIPCLNCRGEGRTVCGGCGGSGVSHYQNNWSVYPDRTYTSTPVPCGMCGGNKKTACRVCFGVGTVAVQQ